MIEHRSYLCVGGPRAGWRVDADVSGGFSVTVVQNPDNYVVASEEVKFDRVKVARVDYRRQTFRTEQGDVSLWVPRGQTALETMELLLDGYEKFAMEKA